MVDPGTLWGVCVLHQQQQNYPQAHKAPDRELVVYPYLGEGCDKAVRLSIQNSSSCSLPMPVYSLAISTFVQGSILLVRINLTPTRMGIDHHLVRLWDLV